MVNKEEKKLSFTENWYKNGGGWQALNEKVTQIRWAGAKYVFLRNLEVFPEGLDEVELIDILRREGLSVINDDGWARLIFT